MGMPEPTPQHRKLERLAGNWSGEEIMLPSVWVPEEIRATGTILSRVDLNGFVVVTDYKQMRDGQVTFAGHGVYTCDPQTGEIVLYWFDCMGMEPNLFRGSFEGNRLRLVSDESTESRPRLTRRTYDFSEDDCIVSRMEMSQDGEQWSLLMDASYKKGGKGTKD